MDSIPPLRWRDTPIHGFSYFGERQMVLEYFDGKEWKPVPIAEIIDSESEDGPP